MLAVVIPAKDEAARIGETLRQVLRLPTELVLPVINGSGDETETVVRQIPDRRIQVLHYGEALGYDVPRIAGAEAALRQGAMAVLFVDGDLNGRLEGSLTALAERVRKGADLVLCDCYEGTPVPTRDSAAARVYQARTKLNRTLGRSDLGPAIPSHGPIAVSRRLLESVSAASIGVPPLMQAEAVGLDLRVEVGARLQHAMLGSAPRESAHRLRIAETIIGDCLQAICEAEGRPHDRGGYLGYHQERRFDLLGFAPPEEVVRR